MREVLSSRAWFNNETFPPSWRAGIMVWTSVGRACIFVEVIPSQLGLHIERKENLVTWWEKRSLKWRNWWLLFRKKRKYFCLMLNAYEGKMKIWKLNLLRFWKGIISWVLWSYGKPWQSTDSWDRASMMKKKKKKIPILQYGLTTGIDIFRE